MGYLLRLGARNVLRNLRRSLLTMLAIAAAVAIVSFADSFVSGALGGAYRDLIDTEFGDVRIARQDYFRRERILPLDALIPDQAALASRVRAVPGVRYVAPRLRFGVYLDHAGRSVPAMGVGIVPETERPNLALERFLVAGQTVRSGEPALLVGKALAARLDLAVGDTLTLLTQTVWGALGGLNLRVAGLFFTGLSQLDANVFYLPFDQAQLLLDAPDRAGELLVFARTGTDDGALAARIRPLLGGTDLAAQPWYEQRYLRGMVPYMRVVVDVLYLIILGIAVLGVINTMLMAVRERIPEIGIVGALGMKPAQVTLLFLSEAGIIAGAGAILGGLVGAGLALYYQVHGMDFGLQGVSVPLIRTVVYARLTAVTLLRPVVAGIIVALIAACYPALRAARLDPARALRRI